MQTFIIVLLLTLSVSAQTITLTLKQIQSWQIATITPQSSQTLFLDNIIGSVTVPTRHIRTLSIPFAVTIERVMVNRFDSVMKGETLALLGGNDWLQMQRELIDKAIQRDEIKTEYARKSALCKEGIIAQKECIGAYALLQSREAEYESVRSLLGLFGVDAKQIKTIETSKTLRASFELHAPVEGLIYTIDIASGSSVDASSPLLTLYEKGDLWIVANVSQKAASYLKLHQKLLLEYDGTITQATVLGIAPIVNESTQTVTVRLGIEQTMRIGLKATMRLSIPSRALIIDKRHTVMQGSDIMVFIATEKGFEPRKINIISEDREHYYSNTLDLLAHKIVSSGTAALKGIMEGSDD